MFWVTDRLGLGPYPLGKAAEHSLRAGGVTHVLNVADGRGAFDASGFEEVAWHPVVDLAQIPLETAEVCLDALHRMLTRPGSPARVYVHCAAGQNRSPTVLWLYLIACGLSPEEAGERIGAASIDAHPGHPALVGPEHVAWAQAWGRERVGHSPGHPAPVPPSTRLIG